MKTLDITHYILIGVSTVTVLALILLGILWFRKYRSLVQVIRDLQGSKSVVNIPLHDSPVVSPRPVLPFVEGLEEETPEQRPLQRNQNRSVSRLPWRQEQQNPSFSKSDLSLLQLIKAGKEGIFYKAKMTRGTCKGHTMFICKIAKEGVTAKRVEMEVTIMKKLVHHKNVLQLLDWNITEEPYVMIMEYMSHGTLRSFLQSHKECLNSDPELQSLLTITSYHIALAMEFLHSKRVVHCDLALRNILVGKFPWEVKVAEFGLARNLTRMRSRQSSHKKTSQDRVPLRWYPPEYFRNHYYSFMGDVWAFGIVMWEMQTFGTLPYPNLETSESVVYYICAGHRNTPPDGCRPEILHIMHDCWLEPYTNRPSFTDIVRILQNIMDNDSDYVEVDNPILSSTTETDNHQSLCVDMISVRGC